MRDGALTTFTGNRVDPEVLSPSQSSLEAAGECCGKRQLSVVDKRDSKLHEHAGGE